MSQNVFLTGLHFLIGNLCLPFTLLSLRHHDFSSSSSTTDGNIVPKCLTAALFQENRVELSLWGTAILFHCYPICGIRQYLDITLLSTSSGHDVILKLPPPQQFSIVFKMSVSWLSFESVIYFLVFQGTIFHLRSASGRLEHVGNTDTRAHWKVQGYCSADNN